MKSLQGKNKIYPLVGSMWSVDKANVEVWEENSFSAKSLKRLNHVLAPRGTKFLVLKIYENKSHEVSKSSGFRPKIWCKVTDCSSINGWIVLDYFSTSYLTKIA